MAKKHQLNGKQLNKRIIIVFIHFIISLVANLINQLLLYKQYKMHSHNNGNSGHGHTHHAGCSHGEQHHVEPQQYFQQLKKLKETNIEFYWMEVMKGAVLAKCLQQYGLGFINSINAQIIQNVVGMAHMMLTCQWLPLVARPFVSGLFWPLLLYVFLNYKIITGFQNEGYNTSIQQSTINLDRNANSIIVLLPIVLFVLLALRTSGRMNTPQNKMRGKKILQIRPYLQNPNLMCRACDIPKAFRAMHCPMCKVCIPKFSRHSLVFGVCVGAANETLAILFFLSISIFSAYFLYKFYLLHSLFGFITQVMLYIINISICWMSTVEWCTFVVLNLNFGLTEFEVQNWMMLQYLMKAPIRQFLNTCNNGFVHNLAENIYALMGISGFEAQLYDNSNQFQQRENQPLRQEITDTSLNNLALPEMQQGKKYIVNWDKAFIYIIPQMPNHPRRNQILQIMKVEQPKMIQNFKLIKKFKKEIQDENPEMNEFQVQQKAMMKMQEHMMKNPQAINMMKPSPEQQRQIQLKMIGHMKMQFKNDTQILLGFEQIESKLQAGTITPDEASMAIRAIQNRIMQKKIQQVMKAQNQQQSQNQMKKVQQKQSSKQNPSPTSIQSVIQTKILQKLEQRKAIVKEDDNSEVNLDKKVQKQQESDKLKGQQIIDDQNL